MPPTTGPTALRTLPTSNLPPRVRTILQRLLRLVDDGLGHMLDRMLMEFELELQRQADGAGTADLHGRYMALLRTVQRGGGELRPRVLARVEDAFARLRDGGVPREQAQATGTPDFRDLRLVEDHQVDERAALKMITTRQEARSGLPLMLLGQRFGVLAAAPAFDAETLPVGPRRLGQMIIEASDVLQIDTPSTLLLLRFLDQQLIGHYAALLEAMNTQLIGEGVLPELTFVPIRKTPRLQNRDADATTTEDVLPQVERRAQVRRGGDRPGQGDGGRRTGDRPERSYTAWMGEAGDDMGADEQREAFDLLRELLNGRRELLGKLRRTQPSATPSIRPELPEDVVDSGLQQLQAQVREGTASLPSDPQDVRHALLVRNREATGSGAAFSHADQDTFELLGLLYRQIHREVRAGSPSHDLLNRLLVPVLRVATHDPRFFIDARHPARALLGAVAEAGAAWLGPEEVDPQYEAQLRDAVQHVLTFFDGDLRVFEEANHWIEDAAGVLARKAEVSERRFVEAARGKEKLELAKRRAAAAVEEALDAGTVPRFTRALLCQAWADVLTLVWLRHGEASDEWASHLDATRQMVAAAHGTPPPLGLDYRIEQALLLVGYHGDDAAVIARHMVGDVGDDDDAAATRTELAMRIKARTRLGAESRGLRAGTPPTPQEAATRERLVALPFGTWIEYVDEPGRTSRRRLAWFSAETDQALFVNQRGQRLDDTTLDAIARDVVAGRAQVVSAGRGRVVDRAWQAALHALRSFAANQPSDAGGPA